MSFIKRILISIDQLGNTLTGGDPDETISSRAGKARREGKWWGCQLCRFLDLFQKDHCEKSLEGDRGEPIPVEVAQPEPSPYNPSDDKPQA